MTWPARTSRFRIERHTRTEPYEPPTIDPLGVADGIVGSIERTSGRDGGRGGAVTLRTKISLEGRHPVAQGLVLIDSDGNVWTVDASSVRSVFGHRRTICDVSRTVGAVTA